MENIEQKVPEQDFEQNIKFIASVLNAEPVINESLTVFNKLVHEDYTNYANENDALAEEAAALLKLQSVQKDLQLVVNCPLLYTKHIVVLGGGFSCGKSSFINSLFQNREIRLPTGINPVTAISAYVIAGQEAKITGYSSTGGRVDISKQMFKNFTHEKMKSFHFNLKKILPYLAIETALTDDFKHICFIDTPGYNPGTESESDMQASVEYIKQASALIWVIGVESGTLPSDDSQMLLRILEEDPDKKIYIICNKADLKSQEEVQGICMEIAGQLDMLSIPYEGIMPYSSREPYTPARLPAHGVVGKSLQEFFAMLNTANTEKAYELAKKIQEVFDAYIRADKQKITYLSQQRKALNQINLTVFADIEKKDAEIAYYKARIDRKRYSDSFRNRQGDSNQDYAQTISQMLNDYTASITKYEDDILSAKELCAKMIQCAGAIFHIDLTMNRQTSSQGIIQQGLQAENIQELVAMYNGDISSSEIFDNRTGTLKHVWIYKKTGAVLEEKIINGKTMFVDSKTGSTFNTNLAMDMQTGSNEAIQRGSRDENTAASTENRVFSSERWHPVSSYEEVAGVWEEAGENSSWRFRLEIYHDKTMFLGLVISFQDVALQQDADDWYDEIYDTIKQDEDANLPFLIGRCGKGKVVKVGMDAVFHFLFEGKELNADGSLLRKTEDDGSYTVFIRQPDRYISAPLRGAAEDSDDWQRITSYAQITGVWKSIYGVWCHEIYADGGHYWGLRTNHYGVASDQAIALDTSIDETWANIAAIEYYYESIANNAYSTIKQYCLGICPGYTFVQMLEFDNDAYYFDYNSWEISKDGNRIRMYDTEYQFYEVFARQEDRYVSAALMGDGGEPENWKLIDSYEEIAGVWERQSEGFWHARYEIYEDGSYYWGNACHNFEDVKNRYQKDDDISVPEAWDVVFEELKESNSKELDEKENIVHYAIGKCPGFTYAEMYEEEDSEQYVFKLDGFELSAEGCRMRRYNEETGEYDIYIRQENRFVSDVFKNREE